MHLPSSGKLWELVSNVLGNLPNVIVFSHPTFWSKYDTISRGLREVEKGYDGWIAHAMWFWYYAAMPYGHQNILIQLIE